MHRTTYFWVPVLTCALLGACSSGSDDPAPSAPIDAVNVFIGTGGDGFGVGSTYPGAVRPFGLVALSPDTTGPNGAADFSHCAGYSHVDDLIIGFSHLHAHGMGVTDYGVPRFMPQNGMSPAKVDKREYRMRFRHEDESASPGYYAVRLHEESVAPEAIETAGPGIFTEVTATDHAGMHRITWADGAEPVMLIDLGEGMTGGTVNDGDLRVDLESGRVTGRVHYSGQYSNRGGGFEAWFDATFEPAFTRFETWSDTTLSEGVAEQAGPRVGAALHFPPGQVVIVRVGLSMTDPDGARKNREAELDGRDFDAVHQEARSVWEDALSIVDIEGGTPESRTIFYTALYHSMLMPKLLSDVDGRYRGLDKEIHSAEGFRYYTDFSLWDTFRTQHPLLMLLTPDWHDEFAESLVQMYRDGGSMPRWPIATNYTWGMIGSSTDLVFAGAALKGLTGFDHEDAWAGSRDIAFNEQPHGGRGGMDDYMTLGWLSAENNGSSASRVLEYANSDSALASFAELMGHEEDAAALRVRAKNYEKVWDAEMGFFRGRKADGAFNPADEFNPLVWMDDFVEGNAWQFLWFVPHDVPGLVELMGGREGFLARLDEFFTNSHAEEDDFLPDDWYWHGNEPDIHAPYLYSMVGEYQRTQAEARWVMDTRYNDGPKGLDGNDDAGTLSAWYVFSALGFFPIAGTDRYILGTPIFERAVVHLPGGDLEIVAPRASDPETRYSGASINDATLSDPWFVHGDIVSGGRMEFRR